MTEEKTNVVTIEGKDYKPEDLTKDQAYFVNQIKDLQDKSSNVRFQLDQITVALNAFTNSLIESVKEEEVIDPVKEELKQ
jgi:hypothetical protein|tara:strand:- start:91 stop:330 length:240 start_codon:yes stop_codon:yes gene_type:complete